MALGKQAKTLTKAQIDALLLHVLSGRKGTRNRVIALLSVRAGVFSTSIRPPIP
jgi:integrase/recombinase XerD